MKLFLSSSILLVVISLTCTGFAQGPPGNQPDRTIDAAERASVIHGLIKQMNDLYVFPETAKKMEQALREHDQKHEYDNITSASSFVEALTSHLQNVSHDKHLRVRYSSQVLPNDDSDRQGPTPEQIAQQRARMATTNFGFEKVERLPGNIGYLDLRGFVPPEMGEETAAAAMNFLANTDALIIDMRKNGGGSPGMVALLASYLFDAKPIHINSIYNRPRDHTQDFWTAEKLAGKRYGPTKPVYVLTSNYTFSGGEEFTYDLKTQKRATIIGENTGGGANPGGEQRITDHFSAFIPTGRAINPITKTNWEGTGVEPDVKVAADKALNVARLSALKQIVVKVTDEQRKGALQREIDNLQKEVDAGK